MGNSMASGIILGKGPTSPSWTVMKLGELDLKWLKQTLVKFKKIRFASGILVE